MHKLAGLHLAGWLPTLFIALFIMEFGVDAADSGEKQEQDTALRINVFHVIISLE